MFYTKPNFGTITTSSPIIVTDSIVSSEIFFPHAFTQPNKFTLNFDFSKPLVSVYETIDNNPDVRKKMADYYYDLIRDKWLLDEINDILNYFVIENGEVQMIDDISKYSKHNIAKDTNKTAEQKVKFITKTLFDRYALTDVLTKFTKGTDTKWVNLPKNEHFLIKFVKEYLMKLILKKFQNK